MTTKVAIASPLTLAPCLGNDDGKTRVHIHEGSDFGDLYVDAEVVLVV